MVSAADHAGTSKLMSLSFNCPPHHFVFQIFCVSCASIRLISGSDLATKARLLAFNTTQSRVVVGLPTGHNTLIRQLYIMWLSNNPTCKKCGTEKKTSVHVLCECEALASLRHSYLGSICLDPEDIRKLSIGAIWNFAEGTGLL
jgi:hypothetical protein